jgi:hypothetical protein
MSAWGRAQRDNGSPNRGGTVAPDGQSFLINTPGDTADSNLSAINVVLNWTGPLKR